MIHAIQHPMCTHFIVKRISFVIRLNMSRVSVNAVLGSLPKLMFDDLK